MTMHIDGGPCGLFDLLEVHFTRVVVGLVREEGPVDEAVCLVDVLQDVGGVVVIDRDVLEGVPLADEVLWDDLEFDD